MAEGFFSYVHREMAEGFSGRFNFSPAKKLMPSARILIQIRRCRIEIHVKICVALRVAGIFFTEFRLLHIKRLYLIKKRQIVCLDGSDSINKIKVNQDPCRI
jgi:hypothetical protein